MGQVPQLCHLNLTTVLQQIFLLLLFAGFRKLKIGQIKDFHRQTVVKCTKITKAFKIWLCYSFAASLSHHYSTNPAFHSQQTTQVSMPILWTFKTPYQTTHYSLTSKCHSPTFVPWKLSLKPFFFFPSHILHRGAPRPNNTSHNDTHTPLSTSNTQIQNTQIDFSR